MVEYCAAHDTIVDSLHKSEERAQTGHAETILAITNLADKLDLKIEKLYKLINGNGEVGLVGSIRLLEERQDGLLKAQREQKAKSWELLKLGLPWVCVGAGAGIGIVIGIAELIYG